MNNVIILEVGGGAYFSMKILIADDDAVSNNLLKHNILALGHEVIAVEDGQSAWEIAQRQDTPHLFILDWMMPGLSGPEVCRKVRAQQNRSYIYIILLTSKTETECMIQGLEAGADEYLTKPFNPQELAMRLNTGERILGLQSDLLGSLSQLKLNEQMRLEFIAALTHDLRTPLVAAKRILEMIRMQEQNFKRRETGELLQGLEETTQHTLQLINHLLEGFQLQEAGLTLFKQPVRLHQLVDECFSSFSVLADVKGIRLSNSIPDSWEPIALDVTQFKRVITNLVSNAITNSPDGSCVDVSARDCSGQSIEIQIKDNGPGIPPDLLPHIFERYYSGSFQSKKIGSGLGLSICKSIIELHGGSIQVASAKEGTCFAVSLPKMAG
jgi:two-component system sensor histidine kinase/response regulator